MTSSRRSVAWTRLAQTAFGLAVFGIVQLLLWLSFDGEKARFFLNSTDGVLVGAASFAVAGLLAVVTEARRRGFWTWSLWFAVGASLATVVNLVLTDEDSLLPIVIAIEATIVIVSTLIGSSLGVMILMVAGRGR